MRSPADQTQWTRAHQTLHRAQLNRARLIKRQRQIDTRDKFLLGNLIYLMGWQDESLTCVENKIEQCMTVLHDDAMHLHLEKLGALAFRQRPSAATNPKLNPLTDEEKRSLVHRKITIGGLWIKHGAHAFKHVVVLGAMAWLDQREQQ